MIPNLAKLEIKIECEGYCVPSAVSGWQLLRMLIATQLSKTLMHSPSRYFPLVADAVSCGGRNVSLAPVKLCPVLSESFRYFCKAALSPLFSFMLQFNFLSLGLRYVSHRRKAGSCIKCLAVSRSPPFFQSELTPILSCTCLLWLPFFFFLIGCFSLEASCDYNCRLLCGMSVPFVHQKHRS